MSTASRHVSAGLEIPTYWTPEQALAVYELIDSLRDKVWLVYSLDIQKEVLAKINSGTAAIKFAQPLYVEINSHSVK